ncbi:YCF48-related protein [Algoriphagus sp.]|uniref:YCF48-related protein n=1 Tax=Algoriphagus sp. TaxID=1872435 RepID=UPI002630EE47|nr:YCF48-related protein [Algoriphagus sp.]
MKKLFFLIPLMCLISLADSLAQTWTRLQGWGLDLETIFWVNDSVAFSGGENLLIRTHNRAQSWQELPYRFEGRVLSIAFDDEMLGLAVGENGLLLKTTDSGQTWKEITLETEVNLKQISQVSELEWIIVGEGGNIFKSTDQGESWTTVASGQTLSLNGFFKWNPDTLYLAGDSGTLLRSQNGGNAWEKLELGQTTDFHGVAFSSALVGYVVGDAGTILKTEDAGQTWTALVSGVNSNLKKIEISPLDSKILSVVGENATALRSINSGGSFAKANLGATNTRNVYDLDFVPHTNTLYAVGQDGYLISSTNAGSTFTQRMAGVRNNFKAADFKTDRYGFIGGENGAFYVTSNAGQSIISRPLPENSDVVGMNFWNNSYGFLTTSSGKLLRTSNAGSAWIDLTPPFPQSINGFYLFATSVIYASGNEGRVTSSFNSGGAWNTEIQSDTQNDLKEIMFFDFQFGIAVGENGQISYSNGGAVWTTLPSLTDNNFHGLAKLDETTAVVVGENGSIFKTTDKALTWRQIEIQTDEDLLDVDFFGSEVGFISGKNGLTMQTGDGGETWVVIPSGTSRDLTGISAGNPLIAYAVGDDGTILSYSCVPPTGNLSPISGPETSCLRAERYSITDDILEGSQIFWRVDGGEIIAGQGSNEVEIVWTFPGRNGVFVSRQNFCGAGETSYLEVIVNDIPTVSEPIEGEGSVCIEQEYSYSVNNQSGVDYNWTVSGGEILNGQGTASVLVIWEEAGDHSISVVPNNSCGKGTAVSKPILVKAQAETPGPITGEGITAPGEKVYEILPVGDLSYQWTIEGEGASILEGQGTASIRVIWQNEGEFTLSVRAQNSCGFSESSHLPVTVSFITSLEPDRKLSLLVYPNPSSGQIFLESENLSQWNSAEVINQLGQSIVSTPILSGQTLVIFQDLPKGVLLVRLKGRSGVVVKKIVVE